jgi:LPXTG-motif cell wall-anchored protein
MIVQDIVAILIAGIFIGALGMLFFIVKRKK